MYITILSFNMVFADSSMFLLTSQYETGDYPYSILCGDLNGDSHNDIAIANQVSHNVSILLNDGYGTFRDAVNYEVEKISLDLSCVDLDNDGDSDLVVANNSGSISILFNNGDGTFPAAINYEPGNGSYPISLFSADLDGDNDNDLAVGNAGTGTVAIMFNDGDGAFNQATHYQVGSHPYSLYCSDLDGDNDKDLVAANRYQDNVSILLNNGDGTFLPENTYDTGDDPVSVFCGDFDGDSHIDLVTANFNSDDVSILLNNGDGTFEMPINYHTQKIPHSVFGSDLDLDGDMDLVVGNIGSDSISILLNNGDGSFQTPFNFGAGSGPVSLFCSDLDGDSDNDLAAVNYRSDVVSIFLNTTISPQTHTVDLDIKPGSCPNPLNSINNGKGKAKLPVAISGTDEIDIREIIPGSITLNGVGPLRWGYEDVSTPIDKENDSCACTEDGADGYEDLVLKFDKNAIIASLSISGQKQAITATTARGISQIGSDLDKNINNSGPPIRNSHTLKIEGRLNNNEIIVGYDCVLLMTKSEDISPALDEFPLESELGVNNPNPFNPVTRINFYTPIRQHVKLEIYNIIGQQVATLIDRTLEAGEHSVEWNGSNSASGVYFYRMQAGKYVETKKMILLK
jgi:hypothetical protein